MQDHLGGEIVKTDVDGTWHYYNFVDGHRYHFRVDQFGKPVRYNDLKSGREDAFLDTSVAQYEALSLAFANVR